LNSGNALLMHQMVGNQLRQGLMMLSNQEIVMLFSTPGSATVDRFQRKR
jgi:hypothetical protein